MILSKTDVKNYKTTTVEKSRWGGETSIDVHPRSVILLDHEGGNRGHL